MPSPQNIIVLLGGFSSEHDVSLRSGTGAVRQLDPTLFRPWPVVMTKDHRWRWPSQPLGAAEQADFNGAAHDWAEGDLSDGWNESKAPCLGELKPAAGVFLALHGEYGEDGRIQALCEFHGLPYTGSNVLGSAIAMDKARTKQFLSLVGMPMARSIDVETGLGTTAIVKRIREQIGLPAVLKVPTGGSSLGMGIARDDQGLVRLVEELAPQCERLLVEEFVSGRELTCGVLEGYPPLPPTEIVPKTAAFFDYAAKYQPGASQEITPAPVDDATTRRLQELARRAHDALGLRAYSRSDFILGPQGPVFLEVNTLPGLTETSLIPQQAAAIGVSYRDLLTAIIRASWSH